MKIRDELKNQVLSQITDALCLWQGFRDRLNQNGPQDNDAFESEQIISSIRVALERVCPPGSTLVKQMETLLSGKENEYEKADKMAAIATTLENSLQNDLLDGFEQLIHGELFDDFLDMAEYLLKEGYKDPAAVIAGSSLESHLRQLCINCNIPVTEKRNRKTIPKRGGKMNDELRAAGIYDANRNRILSSFLGTRNDAAHGDYHKYTVATVETMISGIRSFIAEYPA